MSKYIKKQCMKILCVIISVMIVNGNCMTDLNTQDQIDLYGQQKYIHKHKQVQMKGDDIEIPLKGTLLFPHPLDQFYTIKGHQIIYKKPEDKVWTHFFVDRILSKDKKSSQEFKIAIKSTAHSNIMFGITDKNYAVPNYENNIHSSFMKQNTYTYNGENGCIWGAGKIIKKTGNKFSEGSNITMVVTFKEGLGTIQWKKDGQQIGAVQIPSDKISKITFMPYIEMFDKWDQIIWLH